MKKIISLFLVLSLLAVGVSFSSVSAYVEFLDDYDFYTSPDNPDVINFNPEASNFTTVTQDGVKISAHTDKNIYSKDETIYLYYKVENTNDNPIYVYLTSGGFWHTKAYFYEKGKPDSTLYSETISKLGVESIYGLNGKKEFYSCTFFYLPTFVGSIGPEGEYNLEEGEYTFNIKFEYSFENPDEGNWNASKKAVNLTGDFTITDEENLPPEKEQDGIKLTAEVEKEYNLGEKIDVVVKLENTNDRALPLLNSIFSYEGIKGTLSNGTVQYSVSSDDAALGGDPVYYVIPPKSEHTVTLSFNPPEDAQYKTGIYTLSITAKYPTPVIKDGIITDFDTSSEKEISVSADIKIKDECDLYVSDIGVSKATLTDGDSAALNCVVRNTSNKDVTKEIVVEFYCNGRLFETVTQTKEIKSGEFTIISTEEEKALYFGTHTVSSVIKISDEFTTDTDLENDRIKSRITVLDE